MCRVRADPREVIETEIPEWRIVDDANWFAVHELFATRDSKADGATKPRTKYALIGLGRCAGAAVRSSRIACARSAAGRNA